MYFQENKKSYGEMNFLEKVIDTYWGLWNLLGAILGLCLITVLPFVVIILLVSWLGYLSN